MATGQGKPLPASMKCQGEWIVENHLYLYYSDTSQALGSAAPRFTVGVPRYDGEFCYGIDASQLAAALRTDTATVIDANRAQTLIFLGVADTVPTRGGTRARTYGFQLGETRGSITIETNKHEGTA